MSNEDCEVEEEAKKPKMPSTTAEANAVNGSTTPSQRLAGNRGIKKEDKEADARSAVFNRSEGGFADTSQEAGGTAPPHQSLAGDGPTVPREENRNRRPNGDAEVSKEELLCGSCKITGHSVQECSQNLDSEGFVNACPFCNTDKHNAIVCHLVPGQKIGELYHYFVRCLKLTESSRDSRRGFERQGHTPSHTYTGSEELVSRNGSFDNGDRQITRVVPNDERPLRAGNASNVQALLTHFASHSGPWDDFRGFAEDGRHRSHQEPPMESGMGDYGRQHVPRLDASSRPLPSSQAAPSMFKGQTLNRIMDPSTFLPQRPSDGLSDSYKEFRRQLENLSSAESEDMYKVLTRQPSSIQASRQYQGQSELQPSRNVDPYYPTASRDSQYDRRESSENRFSTHRHHIHFDARAGTDTSDSFRRANLMDPYERACRTTAHSVYDSGIRESRGGISNHQPNLENRRPRHSRSRSPAEEHGIRRGNTHARDRQDELMSPEHNSRRSESHGARNRNRGGGASRKGKGSRRK